MSDKNSTPNPSPVNQAILKKLVNGWQICVAPSVERPFYAKGIQSGDYLNPFAFNELLADGLIEYHHTNYTYFKFYTLTDLGRKALAVSRD